MFGNHGIPFVQVSLFETFADPFKCSLLSFAGSTFRGSSRDGIRGINFFLSKFTRSTVRLGPFLSQVNALFGEAGIKIIQCLGNLFRRRTLPTDPGNHQFRNRHRSIWHTTGLWRV